MTANDRLFNTIKHLEKLAITCKTDIEHECWVVMADAIEQHMEADDENRQ